jgi:hypothetical protein
VFLVQYLELRDFLGVGDREIDEVFLRASLYVIDG